MKIFKDNNTKQSLIKHPDIVLSTKQASRLFALSLFVGCCVFVGGYFWGQRTAVDQLLHSVECDSFADQIYYSMCSSYDQHDDESNEPDAVRGKADTGLLQASSEKPTSDVKEIKRVEPVTAVADSLKPYYAQLAGFGTLKAAEKMKQRLSVKNLNVRVDTRISKSSRGKHISWYQVITPDFENKDELLSVVDKIKKHERIHDVRVIKRG